MKRKLCEKEIPEEKKITSAEVPEKDTIRVRMRVTCVGLATLNAGEEYELPPAEAFAMTARGKAERV